MNDKIDLKPTIEDRVRRIVIEHLDIEPENVTLEAKFVEDLGADSLDRIELVMTVEAEFDIEIADDQADAVNTVGDAVRLVSDITGAAQ
jgi:acyl carrier protein